MFKAYKKDRREWQLQQSNRISAHRGLWFEKIAHLHDNKEDVGALRHMVVFETAQVIKCSYSLSYVQSLIKKTTDLLTNSWGTAIIFSYLFIQNSYMLHYAKVFNTFLILMLIFWI